MKQLYSLVIIALFSFNLAVFGQNYDFNTQSIGEVGNAVLGIPEDYKNDLWLNTNYQELAIGETYDIVARRVPEISSGSSVSLPLFQYELVSGTSISVSTNGLITAETLGTSVIKVSYGEITSGGTLYEACSEVNECYMVVDVIDSSIDTQIEFTSGMSIRSYDTYYFTEGTSIDYTFSLTAANADAIAVYCNGNMATNSGDDYTVMLENRANIIEVIAENATGVKKLYYVVDARKIDIKIENQSNPDESVTPGDEVKISFYGITIPVYKLSTIYNPTFASSWGGEYTKVKFDNTDFGTVETNDPNIGQYSIADYNSINLTFNNAGNFEFTNGRIFEAWWGSELGTEKDMSGPGNPPLNAPINEADFSMFPDFQVEVTEYHYADFEDINLDPESDMYTDASDGPLYETITEEYTSWSYKFNSYGTNWGSLATWFGFAISNKTDHLSAGGPENQTNSIASGDIDNTGNYAVVYDANSGGMSMGPDYDVEFSLDDATQDRIISGCYITNNTYAHNVMRDGNGISAGFGGNDGTNPDWFKLTAEGIDGSGNSTGTVDFYLADFQSENSYLDYILEEWMWFDLSSLGEVSKVKLILTSSDVGTYGMNTPAYYCIDNIDMKRLELVNPVADVTASVDDENLEIDLTDVFTDLGNSDNSIIKTISANINSDVVDANINGEIMTLDFLEEGISTIVIKGKYNGMAITDTITVEVTPSTSLLSQEENSFKLYPNPCTDRIHIESELPVQSIEILSVTGQKLMEEKGKKYIVLGALPRGTYLIRYKISDKVSVSKFNKL